MVQERFQQVYHKEKPKVSILIVTDKVQNTVQNYHTVEIIYCIVCNTTTVQVYSYI